MRSALERDLQHFGQPTAEEESLQRRHAPAVPAVILVGFDRVYGLIKCYPANDASRVLAGIAGTKTLSREVLYSAAQLGLHIEVAPGLDHLFEDFLAGRLS